ncbi:hypothetical protein QJ854_gp069 [Moumouvirus goulette]|uniref:Uncharacterized protein n=1 Tax=Moumouvirus goulette TaxID=1247379 RepID=M1PHY8_9VIRU|nr:hypothetical protein QJ854_gp069 [Moumouvirus goulette]AGF85713.1 hypothetical protein glt_00910 [Moumouvirus goulette]
MSQYPSYVGRKGSKCFFNFDEKFIKENKEKACELIAFYTLALFGHEDNIDSVLMSIGKTQYMFEYPLETCFDKIIEGNMKSKVFHIPPKEYKKLFNPYYGHFISKHMYKNSNKNLLEVEHDHEFFPCQYDIYSVGVYKGEHVLEDKEDLKDMIVGERTSEYETSCEPDLDTECSFCENYKDDINENNFTFGKENNLYTDYKKQIKLNNLIFNFKKYEFNIVIKKNKATVTFDPKSVGGFQHASLWSGAAFEVHHAIPGTLKYENTTHVNEITIQFMGEMVISEYKAIDIL